MKKIFSIFTILIFLTTSAFAITAKRIDTDTTNFDGNLSGSDTSVQSALETLDDVSIPTSLDDLSDVGVTTTTDKNVLVADGDSWESRALVEADISDLGSYLTAEANNLESDGAADIADTEIFIGTGAGTGNYAAMSGEAIMTNAGAVTLADSVTVDSWTLTNVDINSGAIDGTTIGASSASTGAFSNLSATGTFVAGNYTFNTDQTVGAGQDDYVLTYDDASGEIGLEAAGGGDQVLLQKDITIESPADADNFLWFKASEAITISDVECLCDPADTGESVVIDVQERDGTADNPATIDATITCDNDGASDDGSLSNGTIDADDYVSLDIGTVTGTVSQLTVRVKYTVD